MGRGETDLESCARQWRTAEAWGIFLLDMRHYSSSYFYLEPSVAGRAVSGRATMTTMVSRHECSCSDGFRTGLAKRRSSRVGNNLWPWMMVFSRRREMGTTGIARGEWRRKEC
jgi:hypothetical protein